MNEIRPRPTRYLCEEDYKRFVPVTAVWEITLACDLKCIHCCSRAGRRRKDELSTKECIEVIESLARLGTREVGLIGGEAYLRKDWIELIKAIRAHGMQCTIQTGGRNLTPERLARAVEAGLNGVGVSLDGLAPLHDKLRNVPGSFARALDTLERAHAQGVAISVNTQIGSLTMPDLPGLLDTIIEAGATHWQTQLTVAMGNAVDHDELLLHPYQLDVLMPLLADLYKRGRGDGVLMTVGNNIGYYGPYEHMWRGAGDERVHWSGCAAGHTLIALEADGTVKGCPSLATVGFAGGNVRDLSLEEIWRTSEAMHFARLRSTDDLWGFCRTCYYADVCRGGCTTTSHSLLGKPGNNPYCHYRVLELKKQGLRERIVKIEDAAPASFAAGRFDLVTERIADGERVSSIARSGQVIELAWKHKGKRAPDEGRVPPGLQLCRACNQYVHPYEQTCPHCAADIEAAARTYVQDSQRRHALMDEIKRLLY